MIDLHTHSTSSDGSFSLNDLVREAENAGLKAMAITDHDTVASASKLARFKSSTELIAGVELSVFDYPTGYMDLHVLGLFIKPEKMQKKLELLAVQREEQKKATVEKVRELGYNITFTEVKKKAGGSVGRPHIAQVLLEHYPEEFSSLRDVFDKLLGRGKPAYIDRQVGFSLVDAISLIRNAGGLSFLAHPAVYPYPAEKLIRDFKSLGGDGIEVYYDYATNHPEALGDGQSNSTLAVRHTAIAKQLGLLESGGSDFHGKKGQKLGVFGCPDDVLAAMRKHL